MSTNRPLERIQLSSLTPMASAPSDRTAHSQTSATRQPAFVSSSMPLASRATLDSNFVCQNSALVLGVVANRHPGCRCQKQPWTRITAFHLGSTMSGRPIIPFTCRRNRNPRRCSALRISRSGRVLLCRMPAIMRERVAGSTTSAMPFPLESDGNSGNGYHQGACSVE